MSSVRVSPEDTRATPRGHVTFTTVFLRLLLHYCGSHLNSDEYEWMNEWVNEWMPSLDFTARATHDVVFLTNRNTKDQWCRLLFVSSSVSKQFLTATTHYIVNYSRSISFLSLFLTQWGVDDCGQPQRVRRQDEQTEASRVKARRSELLDLPRLYGRRSSSVSMSLWYSIRNVLISTVSSISSGNIYSNNITRTLRIVQLIHFHWFLHVSLYTNICLFHFCFIPCVILLI